MCIQKSNKQLGWWIIVVQTEKIKCVSCSVCYKTIDEQFLRRSDIIWLKLKKMEED